MSNVFGKKVRTIEEEMTRHTGVMLVAWGHARDWAGPKAPVTEELRRTVEAIAAR